MTDPKLERARKAIEVIAKNLRTIEINLIDNPITSQMLIGQYAEAMQSALADIGPSHEPKSPTRNSVALESFVLYCQLNPSQRFWQALRNWSRFRFIFGSDRLSEHDCDIDTFNIEGLDGTRDIGPSEQEGT